MEGQPPTEPIDDPLALNFGGVLAELHAMVGERVSIESAPEVGYLVHQCCGRLGRSIDLQICCGAPLDRPARVWFVLDDADAYFVVSEAGLSAAMAYDVELPEGRSRTVQMHYVGGAVLIVRRELT